MVLRWGAVTVRAHVACNAVLRAYSAPAEFGDGYVLGPDVMVEARVWHGPEWLDQVTRDVDPTDGALADLRTWWGAAGDER